MTDPHDGDPALRARLGRAADGEALPVALDTAALARITARVQQQARADRRRSPVARRAIWLAGFGAAAGLVFALLPRDAAVPQATSAATCVLPGAALEQRAGAQRISLGEHGDLIADDVAAFSVRTSDSCALHVVLTRGTVAVDVHTLGPSRIYLETPHGTVVVRGTRFSIAVADELTVALVDGVIDVQDGEQRTTLAAGHTLQQRRAGQNRRTTAISGEARNELRALLALRAKFAEPEAQRQSHAVVEDRPLALEPESSPTTREARDFLRSAEEARQRGDATAARHFYARATRTRRADGEVALLRWTRFEFAEGHGDVALGLLARHRREFARGALGAEARWLEVSVHQARGEAEAARKVAEQVVARYPGTPQADAARKAFGIP